MTDAQVDEGFALFDQFETEVDIVSEQSDNDISLETAGARILTEAGTYSETVSRCFNAILNGVENKDAASISEISAWEYNIDDEFDDEDAMDFLPEGGYGNFVELVTEGLNI